MSAKIIRTSFCVFLALIAAIRCTTLSIEQKPKRFEKIHLGDDQKQVEALWGPTAPETEEYPPKTFKMLQYAKPDGRPDVIFTIDPSSNRVIGKSKWIYKDEGIYDLSTLNKTFFQDVKWETYVPCHTWSDNDLILVNRDSGLYVATENGHTGFVSWSTPELVNVRVEALYQKCPRLQPKRSNK